MTQEERTKAYTSYISKLNMFSFDSPFTVDKTGDIGVNIFKFADLKGYPKLLIIPNFVVKYVDK